MTKTLTEQWRKGTLNGGIYYLLLRDGTTATDKTVYIVGEKQLRWHYSSFDFVKEVIGPVPCYYEWRQMIDGDKATIHHLKKILPMIEYNKVAYDYLKQVIEDMEKEIEEVK